MSKFEQLISLFVGQAGIQIGTAFWELISIEHGISPDGAPLFTEDMLADYDNADVLFDMGNHGKYIPRAVFVDSEQTVIDEIKTGAYRELFHKGMMLTDGEDAANNYARGSYQIGRNMIDKITNTIRKITEHTDNLSSFFVFNSNGGGTGSGLTPLILLSLMKEYPKITRSAFSVVPGNSYSSAVVEPYNLMLENFATIETADIIFLFENEPLFDICCKKLLFNSPTFTELNRILSLIVSSVTNPIRYSTTLRSSVDDILTNLIPYPRIHYPIARYAPINHISRTPYQKISTIELTKELFLKDNNQSVNVDTNKGLFLSIILNYQGLVNVKDIHKVIESQRSNNQSRFVEWSPTGFKVGVCNQLPTMPPMGQMAVSDLSATMLINSSAIAEFFKTQVRKFDLLYSKRSFVHWYTGEGLEDVEFQEARHENNMLVNDLNEIGMSEKEIEDYIDQGETNTSRQLSFKKPASDSNRGAEDS